MIKAYLFDMGGVVDHFNSEVMESRLISLFTGEETNKTFKDYLNNYSEIHEKMLRGLMSEEEFFKTLRSESSLIIPDEPHLYTKFFNPITNLDTIAIIQKLKANGNRVLLGTNVETPHRLYHEKYNDYAIFDKVYTSDTMHIAKPDPGFWMEILKHENLQPQEVFFTDDNYDNIQAAKQIGLQTHLFVDAEGLLKVLEE